MSLWVIPIKFDIHIVQSIVVVEIVFDMMLCASIYKFSVYLLQVVVSFIMNWNFECLTSTLTKFGNHIDQNNTKGSVLLQFDSVPSNAVRNFLLVLYQNGAWFLCSPYNI